MSDQTKRHWRRYELSDQARLYVAFPQDQEDMEIFLDWLHLVEKTVTRSLQSAAAMRETSK